PAGKDPPYAEQRGPAKVVAGSMVSSGIASGVSAVVSDVSGAVDSAESSVVSELMEHPDSTRTLAKPSDRAAVIFFLVLNMSTSGNRCHGIPVALMSLRSAPEIGWDRIGKSSEPIRS